MAVIGKSQGAPAKRYLNQSPGTLVILGGFRLYREGSVTITKESYDAHSGELDSLISRGWIREIEVDSPKDVAPRSVYEHRNNDPLAAPEDDDPDNIFVKQKNQGMNQSKNYFVDESRPDDGNIINGHNTKMIEMSDTSLQNVSGIKSNYVNTLDRAVRDQSIDTGSGQFDLTVKNSVTMAVAPGDVVSNNDNITNTYTQPVVSDVSRSQDVMVKTAEIQTVDPDVIPDSVITGQMGYVHDKSASIEDGYAGTERKISCVSGVSNWRDACKLVGEVKNTEELEVIIRTDGRPSVVHKAKNRLSEIKRNMAQ